MVGGGELVGKPVAWINAASVAAPTAAAGAHAELATVLGYVDARVVEQACARMPVRRDAVGSDGTVADPGIRERVAGVVALLADHARR